MSRARYFATIEGEVLSSEVTDIPRRDLIAEIVRAQATTEAERIEALLALGCETCQAAASTVLVMESDIDRTVHIVCDEHRPRRTW